MIESKILSICSADPGWHVEVGSGQFQRVPYWAHVEIACGSGEPVVTVLAGDPSSDTGVINRDCIFVIHRDDMTMEQRARIRQPRP